jgi:hypothetical protein
MRVPYPKKPKDIRVRIIDRAVNDGLLSDIQTTAEVPLNVKLNDYIVRLGYSSANLVGFIVQLFIHGKVRIDFSSHIERLELLDPKDSLSGAQAMSLLEDFLEEVERSGENSDFMKPDDATQKIVVHTPKKSRN